MERDALPRVAGDRHPGLTENGPSAAAGQAAQFPTQTAAYAFVARR
ncbi:hypothetical protein [Streptomyces sp. NPDC054866]